MDATIPPMERSSWNAGMRIRILTGIPPVGGFQAGTCAISMLSPGTKRESRTIACLNTAEKEPHGQEQRCEVLTRTRLECADGGALLQDRQDLLLWPVHGIRAEGRMGRDPLPVDDEKAGGCGHAAVEVDADRLESDVDIAVNDRGRLRPSIRLFRASGRNAIGSAARRAESGCVRPVWKNGPGCRIISKYYRKERPSCTDASRTYSTKCGNRACPGATSEGSPGRRKRSGRWYAFRSCGAVVSGRWASRCPPA